MTTQAVSGRRYFTKAWLLEQKSLIALLVLIAIVSTMSPNFFTVNNLFNILQQTSVNAIMAVGMTLVILTSGIDLSVGSLLALTGAVAASIVGIEVNALVAVAAALALGAAIGAVTGVIVAKGRVQAFIATLVMMLLLRGVTNFYGVSLVLLQLLNVAEQRFVELRIMLFNFRRENGRLDLHFTCHHIQYLHKRRYALG